jgi:DNA-binding transcriptional LysR family regulator
MTRPEVRELECFVALAEHLNFSRAAQQLNLSQPPLTRRLQALEGKLNTRLLKRNTHAVSLTDSGRLFLDDARSILHQLDRCAETVRRAGAGESSRLRLAFVGVLLDARLVHLVQRFRAAHPECQAHLDDLSPAAQLEALQNGLLDGGFIGAQPSGRVKGIRFITLRQEPLALVLPKKHPLTKIAKLEWRHLRSLAWVLVSQTAAPAFRGQFAELARRHALAEKIVQESERMPAVLTMVAAGNGVTMAPQSAARLISREVIFRDLPRPRPTLEHTFACRIDPALAPLEAFLSLLRDLRIEKGLRVKASSMRRSDKAALPAHP